MERGEHHHTKFSWKGYSVENHYDFVNRYASREAAQLDDELKRMTSEYSSLNKKSCVRGVECACVLPSADLHACFLLRHEASHFSATSLDLRQLLDWGLFFRAHHTHVDRTLLANFARRFGMEQFLLILNAACVKVLGLSEKIFYTGVTALLQRFIADMLKPEFDEGMQPVVS